jgi:hypothetical protein
MKEQRRNVAVSAFYHLWRHHARRHTVAPRSTALLCGAMHSGATGCLSQPDRLPKTAMSALCGAAMHGATVWKCGAAGDGATKTVSFKKYIYSRFIFEILLKNG